MPQCRTEDAHLQGDHHPPIRCRRLRVELRELPLQADLGREEAAAVLGSAAHPEAERFNTPEDDMNGRTGSLFAAAVVALSNVSAMAAPIDVTRFDDPPGPC